MLRRQPLHSIAEITRNITASLIAGHSYDAAAGFTSFTTFDAADDERRQRRASQSEHRHREQEYLCPNLLAMFDADVSLSNDFAAPPIWSLAMSSWRLSSPTIAALPAGLPRT